MPVLKAQTFRPASKDAVVLDLGDLSRQAAKLRAIAESKAERILADAQSKADELIASAADQGDKRGYAEGLQRGLDEGKQQGQTQAIAEHTEAFAELTRQWTQVIADFDGKWETFEREATAASLHLAVCLAKKVVQRTVQTDTQLIVDQARAALARVLEPAAVQLRICPDDRPAMQEALPQLTDQLTNVRGIDLLDDPNVSRGGCVVVNGVGRIDATIETQLDRLCEHLLGQDHQGQGSSGVNPEAPSQSTPDQLNPDNPQNGEGAPPSSPDA